MQAAILQNHGLLVATNTIESTLFYFIALERACQAQLMSDAAAGGRGTKCNIIPPEDAAATYTVPFRSIRPSPVPSSGGLDEIGSLSPGPHPCGRHQNVV